MGCLVIRLCVELDVFCVFIFLLHVYLSNVHMSNVVYLCIVWLHSHLSIYGSTNRAPNKFREQHGIGHSSKSFSVIIQVFMLCQSLTFLDVV